MLFILKESQHKKDEIVGMAVYCEESSKNSLKDFSRLWKMAENVQ